MSSSKMTMHKSVVLAFAAFAVLIPASGCAQTNNPNATFTVRVVDEEGNPLSDVRSELINIYDYGAIKAGLTNTNGVYSKHLDRIYHVSGYFQKSGYYESKGVFWKAPNLGDIPPADTNFTIVMKRIIEPIQMKRKEVHAVFPRLDESVGFDLVIGDWVLPDGEGEIRPLS